MPEATSSPIQPEQNVGPAASPKSRSKLPIVLLLVVIAFLLVGLGAGGYYLLTKDKEGSTPTTEEQSCTYNNQTYNDSASFDATDGCNTCLCNDGAVVCTELTCNEGTEDNSDGNNNQTDPYAGWVEVNLFNDQYSMKIPNTWTLDSDVVQELVPGETSAMAYFTNSYNEKMVLGNYLQSGDPGSMSGCDIGIGQTTRLFTIKFADQDNVAITISYCFVDADFSGRVLSMSADKVELYSLPIAFGGDTMDADSSIDQLREKYEDVKLALESFQSN